MLFTENEKLIMKVQICNHHSFWKGKSIKEIDFLDTVEDYILKQIFLDSLIS